MRECKWYFVRCFEISAEEGDANEDDEGKEKMAKLVHCPFKKLEILQQWTADTDFQNTLLHPYESACVCVWVLFI